MIITCPHCQTKYQVAYEAIGSVGRKVQCAHCQEAWQQAPVDKDAAIPPAIRRAVEALVEDGLDEALIVEERAVASELASRASKGKAAARAQSEAGRIDPAVIRKRQKDFSRRQHAILAEQPLARLRRGARIVSALALCAVLATAYFGRAQVVQRYPAMADVYKAVGLGVNVVGLDFSNVSTLATMRDGKAVLIVSAQIVGLTPQPVPVPAVIVTLIDGNGRGIYEWSVAPSIRDLMAGERSTFDTQLTLPPGDATRVRLSFAGGSSMRDGDATSISPAPAAVSPQSTEPAHTVPEHH